MLPEQCADRTYPIIPGYPYSQAFMAQVFANAALRENHPTLDNSDLKNSIAVCMMFLGLNHGTVFNERFLTDCDLDDYMRLPLVKESAERIEDFEFGLALQSLISDAGPRNKFVIDSPRLPDMADYVRKNAKAWQQFPSAEQLDRALSSELNRLFAAHGWSNKVEADVDMEE